jgi:hypothetical protein
MKQDRSEYFHKIMKKVSPSSIYPDSELILTLTILDDKGRANEDTLRELIEFAAKYDQQPSDIALSFVREPKGKIPQHVFVPLQHEQTW